LARRYFAGGHAPHDPETQKTARRLACISNNLAIPSDTLYQCNVRKNFYDWRKNMFVLRCQQLLPRAIAPALHRSATWDRQRAHRSQSGLTRAVRC
jgi:hypothetical protein